MTQDAQFRGPVEEQELIELGELGSTNREMVANAAVQMASSVANFPAKVQALAAAVALWSIVKTTTLRPLDALNYVENMSKDKRHATRKHPTFAALLWHVRDYLMGKRYS